MAFRSKDNLQRYELIRYQVDHVIRAPANNQGQIKNGYKFTVNGRSSLYDRYNAYFEVQFQLQKLANGNGYADADRITVINGAHSFIKHLMIKSAGKIVEYSEDFSRSVAKKQSMVSRYKCYNS